MNIPDQPPVRLGHADPPPSRPPLGRSRHTMEIDVRSSVGIVRPGDKLVLAMADPIDDEAWEKLRTRLEGRAAGRPDRRRRRRDRPGGVPAVSEKPKGVRVTAGDLEAGETGTAGIMDDYVLICAGACRAGRTQAYANGTRILTVMGVQRKAPG